MDSIGERIREVRKALDMTQEEFAKKLGIGQSTLAMMEVSKRDISDRHIKTICAICNINERWLRTGEGDMFLISDSISLDSHAISCGLSKSDIKVIKKFITLYPSIKDILLEITRNED